MGKPNSEAVHNVDPRSNLQRMYENLVVATSIAVPVPTLGPFSESEAGLIQVINRHARFCFWGKGTAGTGLAKAVGYDLDPGSGLYIPMTLFDASFTLGTAAGPSSHPNPVGLPINNNILFADAVTVTPNIGLEASDGVVTVQSDTNGVTWVWVDGIDSQFIKLHLAKNSSTGVNAFGKSF